MNAIKIIITVITIVTVAACNTQKSATTTLKSADGIYPPRNEELTAIQAKYKDVTLEKLKEGHTIYTAGACINCHGAKNIYQYTAIQWEDIINDMAWRAHLADAQKDAVYKYVLAIKATQPTNN